jgi:hypothetical protein
LRDPGTITGSHALSNLQVAEKMKARGDMINKGRRKGERKPEEYKVASACGIR